MKSALCKLFTFTAVMLTAVLMFTAGGPAVPPPTMLAHDSALPLIGIAGMIINTANLSALFTGIKTAFNTGFREATTLWNKVATLVPSTTSDEKYGWLGQFPRLREWIGDRYVKSIAAHDYSIKNKTYEGTIGIPREKIEDDQYGVFAPLYQEMGYAAATHPDELVFALLAAGFTTPCFDGQFFFDTDHPVGDQEGAAVSVSNMQAGAGNPWFLLDTSRPLKPLIFQKRKEYNIQAMTTEDDEKVFMSKEFRYGVDARCNVGFGFWQQGFGSKAVLDKTNFDAAVAAMMAFKSDEGRPLGVKATVLVCGPSNRAAANDVVLAEKLASGASNTNFKAVEVMVVPWLT